MPRGTLACTARRIASLATVVLSCVTHPVEPRPVQVPPRPTFVPAQSPAQRTWTSIVNWTNGIFRCNRERSTACDFQRNAADPDVAADVEADAWVVPIAAKVQEVVDRIEVTSTSAATLGTLLRQRHPSRYPPPAELWRQNLTSREAMFDASGPRPVIRWDPIFFEQTALCVTLGGEDYVVGGQTLAVAADSRHSAVVGFALAHEYAHYLDWVVDRKLSASTSLREDIQQLLEGVELTEQHWPDLWADYFAGFVLALLREVSWMNRGEERCAMRLLDVLKIDGAHLSSTHRLLVVMSGIRSHRTMPTLFREALGLRAPR